VIYLKRNAEKLFINVFLKSFFVVAVLLTTGILSYKAAMLFWQPRVEKSTVAYQEETVPDNTDEVRVEEVTKNLILCYEDESKKINKAVLEVLNCKNNQLTYITIPVKTQLTLSKALYNKIILDYPEFPQLIKLSTISNYMELDEALDYEVLITEELLGTDISYYTAMPQSTYDTMFADKYIKQADGYDSVPMEAFTNDLKKDLKTFDTKEELKAYIEEIYSSFTSNLSLEDKMNYLDSYYQASLNGASFDLLPGKNFNNHYELDRDLSAQQLTELTTIN
jgi:hypothetical protein